MAIEIVSQSYLPRKPLVVCNADSLAELSTLTNVAEGSKATVNGTEYVYENNSGWVEPGSGGGGGGGIVTPTYTSTYNETTEDYDISCDMEFSAIEAAVQAGVCVGAYFVRTEAPEEVEFYPLSASVSGQVLIFMMSEPMENPEMEFTGLSIFRTILHQFTGDITQVDQIPQS